jgi:ribonuclease P protein component
MSIGRALGGAVVRNRIRRRLREILRAHRQEISSGWDIILHPRASVATSEFRALTEELLGLLRSALTATASPAGPEASGRSTSRETPREKT